MAADSFAKLKKINFIIALIILVLYNSCSSPKYFYDFESRERQIELRKNRSGNIFANIGLSMVSVVVMSTVNVDVGLYPETQEFKKLKIINPTSDSIYINMLTNVFWDENNYCDFLDIRIPPKQKCKVLVPVNADYNLYFSNTTENGDDELLEINTDKIKKISLNPGITIIKDSTNLYH